MLIILKVDLYYQTQKLFEYLNALFLRAIPFEVLGYANSGTHSNVIRAKKFTKLQTMVLAACRWVLRKVLKVKMNVDMVFECRSCYYCWLEYELEGENIIHMDTHNFQRCSSFHSEIDTLSRFANSSFQYYFIKKYEMRSTTGYFTTSWHKPAVGMGWDVLYPLRYSLWWWI